MPLVGPHLSSTVNSHAPARQMLTRGVLLTDISQVLRHRDLAITALATAN